MTPSHEDLLAALSELSSLMLTSTEVEDGLQHVADGAVRAIPSAISCGVTLWQERHPVTVGSAGDLARALDEVQYAQDDGPCLESMRTEAVVLVEDMARESRWGPYPAFALTYGARSMLSTPLRVAGGGVLGALNLYSREPDAFGPSERATAATYAEQAGTALTSALRYSDQVQLTDQLQEALQSRAVIDQALGIIIAQRYCTPDEAFDVLRSASQRMNRKLRVVAADLVEGMAKPRTSPVPQPPTTKAEPSS